MKNSFKFLFVILCLVLLCLVTGCQEENVSDSIGQDTSEEENVRDSIGQDASFQEVYDAFMAQEEAVSFADFSLSHLKMRVYRNWDIRDLIQGASFEELLAADDGYYITHYHDQTRRLYFRWERWNYDHTFDQNCSALCWLEAFWENPLCFFEKSTNSAIPESATVKAAYFLIDNLYSDHFVFYRTNKGNFVLFIDGPGESADLYLLPEDIFYDKIQECKILPGDVYGPPYRITADFSDWKLNMQ